MVFFYRYFSDVLFIGNNEVLEGLVRLFHRKALGFMSGLKSTGQTLVATETKSYYDLRKTAINFAVPNSNAVSNFSNVELDLPRELPTGIIEKPIKMKNTDISYVLSVDGNKLAPGLNAESGDQDLFGFEEQESLEMAKNRIQHEIDTIELAKENWQSLVVDEKVTKIEEVVIIVSGRVKDLRLLFQKQKLALKKFQKEAGEDWKNSNYVYAISSVQSMIYQIQTIVGRLLEVNNLLLGIGSSLHSTQDMFVEGKLVDSFSQKELGNTKGPNKVTDSISRQ